VGTRPEPFADVPGAVPDCHAPALEPAIRAVEAAQAVFDLVFALARDGGSPGLLDAFPVIGVLHFQPAPTQQFARRAAQVLHNLRAGVVHAAVGHVSPDELRQRLGQAPPALLTLAQGLLNALAVGDVMAEADKANDVPTPVAVGSLGREVGAGHAAGAQLVLFGGGHSGFHHLPIMGHHLTGAVR